MNDSNIERIKIRFLSKLDDLKKRGFLPKENAANLEHFFQEYLQEISPKENLSSVYTLFFQLLEKIEMQIQQMHVFGRYHEKILYPFDYHSFGKDFVRPLIDLAHSTAHGIEKMQAIEQQLKRGENAIFFANHQTEVDPQIMFVLLEKKAPFLVDKLIFVAGERVIKDPHAIPFSLGCNLFCIYSRKYIATPPEKREEKQLHNKKTMQVLKEQLDQGGKCIYVAPSGGRDRMQKNGEITLAPFDEKSIAMLHLMAKKASSITRFYPLALQTYHLLPPPNERHTKMGEERRVKRVPVGLFLGEEIPLDEVEKNGGNKQEIRAAKRDLVYNRVIEGYQQLI